MLRQQLDRDWKFKTRIDSQLSPELKSMIRKMLEPDPKKRVTASQLLEDPWIKKFKNQQ